MKPQEAAYEDRVPLETPNIFCLWPHRHRGCALGSLWLTAELATRTPAAGDEPEDHRQAETPSFPPIIATSRFPQNTVQWAHRMLTPKCWRRPASAVGYAVVRVLPMTCRNSASLRVRQSSGRVAPYLVMGTLRSRTAESYANAGVRPVAITTPEHSCVGIGYQSLRRCCPVAITTPELPASASGIAMAVTTCFQLDYVICYCVPPHHEGDTLRTLTPWLH